MMYIAIHVHSAIGLVLRSLADGPATCSKVTGSKKKSYACFEHWTYIYITAVHIPTRCRGKQDWVLYVREGGKGGEWNV